jgi:hypothetical protein
MTAKVFVLSFLMSVTGQLVQTNYLPPNSYITDVKSTIATKFVTNGIGNTTTTNTIALTANALPVVAATDFTTALNIGAPVSLTMLSNTEIKNSRKPTAVVVTLNKAVDASNTTVSGTMYLTIFGVQR